VCSNEPITDTNTYPRDLTLRTLQFAPMAIDVSHNKLIISLNINNWLVFVMEALCVYCEVGTDFLLNVSYQSLIVVLSFVTSFDWSLQSDSQQLCQL
jgi:hypothetical protein